MLRGFIEHGYRPYLLSTKMPHHTDATDSLGKTGNIGGTAKEVPGSHVGTPYARQPSSVVCGQLVPQIQTGTHSVPRGQRLDGQGMALQQLPHPLEPHAAHYSTADGDSAGRRGIVHVAVGRSPQYRVEVATVRVHVRSPAAVVVRIGPVR